MRSLLICYSAAYVTLPFRRKANCRTKIDQVKNDPKPDTKMFSEAFQSSYSTYHNIDRGERELGFLMALRICRFYQMGLDEFISMLNDKEFGRTNSQ